MGALESPPARAPALQAILLYKAVKGPLMLGLAAWLALAPQSAENVELQLVHHLMEGGALLSKWGEWLRSHVSLALLERTALLAALDGTATVVEAVLLWRGKPWGEWLVVAGLAALVPFELASWLHHPGGVKAVVLGLNVAIVAYLTWHRLRTRPS